MSSDTESVATFEEDDDPQASPALDLALGEQVGERFTVLSPLGRGGYASVYVARDEVSGTDVALKILRVDRLSATALKRMTREADTAREFQHERLVRVLDHGRVGDTAFLAMELVKGGTLRDRMRVGAMSPAETVRVAMDVLEGLAALHQRGIVHRDVKPSNILLDPSGRAKLADFGLVTRWADDQSRATQSHAIVGTLEYVSPEQALGEDLDGRSDLYSLGVVLYEMLSGAPLHGARSSLGKLVAHLTKEAPDVRTSRSEVAPWLASVTARLLEKDRHRRYPSAEAALSDLRDSQAPSWRPAPPREWRLGVMMAALIATATGLLSLAWMNRSPEVAPPSKNLASAEVKRGVLRGLDVNGEVLWTYAPPAILDDAAYAPPVSLRFQKLRVADLEGDGRNEALLIAEAERGGLGELLAFESDGRIRFKRRPGRTLRFADGKVYEGFNPHAVHFFIDRRGRPRLFLISNHRPWFPGFLEEVGPSGELASEYVANGNQIDLVRLDFQGKDVPALTGPHNETRGGSVTLLSLDDPNGRAPSADPEFRCDTCRPKDPLAIVIAPRADVLTVLDGAEACAVTGSVVTLGGGEIDFGSRQGSFTGARGFAEDAMVSYTLSAGLDLVLDVRPTEVLKAGHDTLLKLGKLDHRWGKRDLDGLARVLKWDGSGWSPLPVQRAAPRS